jgi:hypothetical protein
VSVHVVHVTHLGFVRVVHMTHSTGARVRLYAPHGHSTWPHASTYRKHTCAALGSYSYMYVQTGAQVYKQ